MKFLLIFIILLVGCTGPEYEKEETIAVLEGEEITAEDVLWQSSLEKEPEDIIKSYLKQEVVIKEAKNMEITVSEKEVEERVQEEFPGADLTRRFEAYGNKDFYREQASLLGVSPEEYYETWEEINYTRGLYWDKYFNEKFGEPTEKNLESWTKKVDEHGDELFNAYKKEGKWK
ncbi:hypothetical protein J2S78_000490 [Salibacterium salarium]|uniref:hypothetical protein n=1 Tax=Salibacterium salarium TaxID=284579 RepID=UPI00278ABA1D|nr:hypothetical protein [Salibacterium salarium]MDQ0298082.1 hypothetical protein [Salibacterium salarium]